MYSGYGFAFSICNASAKTTTHVFMALLIHNHDILYNIDSGQVTIS